MFALRRAALRTLTQSSWQTPAFRSVSRTALVQISKSTITRAFHQSRSRHAEDTRAARNEPSIEQEVKEEDTIAPEIADVAKATTLTEEAPSQPSSTDAPSTTEKVKQTAIRGARKVQDFASNAAEKATSAVSLGSAHLPASSKILYVGNLFYEVTAAQLEAEFGRIGEVVNSRVVTDTRGLSRGHGYVEFATVEEAKQAIDQLDQRVFQGRRLAVQHHIPRPRSDTDNTGSTRPNRPTDTLFIGNMSYQMSDRDLNELFRDINDVLDVRVAIDRRSGQPRGFAHADFVDVAAAQNAKKLLENKTIFGRKLRVDFGRPHNKTQSGDGA